MNITTNSTGIESTEIESTETESTEIESTEIESTETESTETESTASEFYDVTSIVSTLIRIASQYMQTDVNMTLAEKCNNLDEGRVHPGVALYLGSDTSSCEDVVSYVEESTELVGIVNNFVANSIKEGEFISELFLSQAVNAYYDEMIERATYFNNSNIYTPPLDPVYVNDLYSVVENFVCVESNFSFVCDPNFYAFRGAEDRMAGKFVNSSEELL